MQVNGGSQSFNVVNTLRLLGRWMRMFTVSSDPRPRNPYLGPTYTFARAHSLGLSFFLFVFLLVVLDPQSIVNSDGLEMLHSL